MENVGLKPSQEQDAQMLITLLTEPGLPSCVASPLWPLGSLHTKGLDDFKVLCVTKRIHSDRKETCVFGTVLVICCLLTNSYNLGSVKLPKLRIS